jgi:hypothetical protein
VIEAERLLADLQKQLERLETDLLGRAESDPAVRGKLVQRYQDARSGERTGVTYETWLGQQLTQVAVGWLLACVFTRFCEDNRLLDHPMLAGSVHPAKEADEHGPATDPVDGVAEARERQAAYFQLEGHDKYDDLDYLRAAIFRLEEYPATRALVDKHNPLHIVDITPDAATRLLNFWRYVPPELGRLAHDFTDPDLSTRFLGDLYQDLSEQAKTDYALLQTPKFVETEILKRTLAPAIDKFGLTFDEDNRQAGPRVIDPACGSGHFLLGGFDMLLSRWRDQEKTTNVKVHVERVLTQVHGVDLNPFAAAIARFRLVVAALFACEITRLADAPAWRIRVAIGDSLLWGVRPGNAGEIPGFAEAALAGTRGEGEFTYEYENAQELLAILGARYEAVVANPPYITVKDSTLSKHYRAGWDACHRQYSLAVPFVQRIFNLAVPGGFTGQITANSFMKREFGRKLIERYLPTVDLTLILDTKGAHIPGHGTPTVIIFGRNNPPIGTKVRAVLGIKGEPGIPADPARGLVWTSIVENIDNVGAETPYSSTQDLDRSPLSTYPWTLAGGGVSELLAMLGVTGTPLHSRGVQIGRIVQLGEDEAFILPATAPAASRFRDHVIGHVFGELVRDYSIGNPPVAINPYVNLLEGSLLDADHEVIDQFLWPRRTVLAERTIFGRCIGDAGRPWYAYLELYRERLRNPLSIVFPFVQTHNHFSLDRGGKIFNRTATVIKLSDGRSEEDHLRLLGLLNSSTACFWLKQVSHDKGNRGGERSTARYGWEHFFEFTGTKLAEFPLPDGAPLVLATRLDALARGLQGTLPDALAEESVPTRAALDKARYEWERIRAEMISTQEELDWEVYGLYRILGDDEALIEAAVTKPPLVLGERAFEIALARQDDAGEGEAEWFTRHHSTPIKDLPSHWPADYRALVERRIEKTADDAFLPLLERPENKRRWVTDTWEEMEAAALRGWLLDRLEDRRLWFRPDPTPRTAAQLADELVLDPDFASVAALYARDTPLVDVVAELVKAEHVPFLAALRYSDAGMRIRAQWERTWKLQRLQDAEDERVRVDSAGRRTVDERRPAAPVAHHDIKKPPKYKQSDFREYSYYRNRGTLDVPKERFISYPDASRDGTMLLGWAGWDHLQQAQVLATYIADRRVEDAWGTERLTPLLAGVAELLPWIRQWHPDVDEAFGQRPGDAYEGFLDGQLLELGLTRDDLDVWRPVAKKGRGRRAAAVASDGDGE